MFVKLTLLLLLLLVAMSLRSVSAQPYAGADVSMLLEIEKAGGAYRDEQGAADAISILRRNGCNLFRLRLFVDPTDDFRKSHGATQDLLAVKQLARRVKASGAKLLLDFHYSDTWADPMHQTKPAAWEKLELDGLEKQVQTYTAEVLNELKKENLQPEMVQIGNEIAGGMLWPQGKVDVPKEQQPRQWAQFARLLNAGARAVRETSESSIILHIHGGGRPGLPQWFFNRLAQEKVDYDQIALSFYPQWGDSLSVLTSNLNELKKIEKPVLLAEVSYPWKTIDGVKDPSLMQWATTPDGQAEFVTALNELARSKQIIGYVWWYPEAIPVADLHIWKGGGEALFDARGAALPAMRLFGALTEPTKP